MRIPLFFVSIGAAGFLGCGGAPPPPPAPAASIATPPAQHAPHAEAAPDTSPVPAPSSVFVVLHVRDIGGTIRAARQLFGPTGTPADNIAPEAMAAVFLGTELANVVDLTKPIDVAMLQPNGDDYNFVASLAVTSIDDARQNLTEDFTLTPKEGGVISIGRGGGEEAKKLKCELRPAAGSAPYRLLCATTAHALKTVAPYLARTVAREESGGDVRLQMNLGAAAMKAAAEQKGGSAAEALGRNLVLGITNDLDVLTVEAGIENNALLFSAKQTFRGTSSPVSKVLAAQGGDATPIPDLFWRLPSDSFGAIYARGASAADLEPLRNMAIDGLSKAIVEDDGLSTDDAQREAKLFLTPFLTGGPVAAAYGFDTAAALKALSGVSAAHPASKEALHGWALVALDEPASRWIGWIRDMNAFDKEIAKKPRGPHKPDESKTTTLVAEERVTDAKLPPQSAHFIAREYEKVKGAANTKKPPKTTTHIYIVPSGSRTWIGFSQNAPLVLKKVHGVLSGTPESGLGGRKDLQELHTNTNFGGFLSLALIDALGLDEDDAQKDDTRSTLEHLAASAAQSEMAVPFFAAPVTSGSPGMEVRVRVPKEVLKEAVGRAH